MAKTMQIGVNDVAKNVKDIYIGVNNVAKKAVRAYIGVNNVAKLFWEKATFPVDAVIRLYEGTSNRLGIGVGYNKASEYRRVADSSAIAPKFKWFKNKWWYPNSYSLFCFDDDSTAITEWKKQNNQHWIGIINGLVIAWYYSGDSRKFRSYDIDTGDLLYTLDVASETSQYDTISVADWDTCIIKPNGNFATLQKATITVDGVTTTIPIITEFTITKENGFSNVTITEVPKPDDAPDGWGSYGKASSDCRNFFVFSNYGTDTRDAYVTDGVNTYACGKCPNSKSNINFFVTDSQIILFTYKTKAGGHLLWFYTSRDNPSLPLTMVETDVNYNTSDEACSSFNFDGQYLYGSDYKAKLLRLSPQSDTWTLMQVDTEASQVFARYWLKTETGLYEPTN